MYKKQQSTWNIRHLVYVSSSLFFFSSWSSQSEVHRHYKLEMNSKWFGCFFPPLEMVCWVLPSHTHNHLKIWAVNSSLQGHHSLDPASPGVGSSVTAQAHSLMCTLGEQKTAVHQPSHLLHAAPLVANTQTNHEEPRSPTFSLLLRNKKVLLRLFEKICISFYLLRELSPQK